MSRGPKGETTHSLFRLAELGVSDMEGTAAVL